MLTKQQWVRTNERKIAENWNELVIVAKKDGAVHVFSAWKRAIAAWLSPERWQDPETWPKDNAGLVKMPPQTPWSPQSYGIIAFDFDSRTCWSFNDFQVPGSGYLLDEYGAGVSHFMAPEYRLPKDPKERDLTGQAWAQAVRDPSSWKDLHIEVMPSKFSFGPPRHEKISLQAIMGKIKAPIAAKIDATLRTHRGWFDFDGKNYLPTAAAYAPPGWTVHRAWDFGDPLSGVLSLTEALKDWPGFDQPQWVAYVQDSLTDYIRTEGDAAAWGDLARPVEAALREDPDMAEELDGVLDRLLALGGELPSPAARLPKK